MMTNSLDRLEDTIEAETAALLSHDWSDQPEFNRRKSQGLLELSRMVRAIDTASLDHETIARLKRLRAKIELNHSVLEMNLRAVQEVADIVSGAIRNAESDGTYSAFVRRQDEAR
ncbi:flagellar protein FlgN [Microvirga flavescens]|uniref:flagellar protein FlgN n=1 Tax=Microvirga flavescens TaxID=2249811 RepID=UPI000DD547A1|nr:flagellar protein FlgN [Microvirga flavescens]